MESKNPKKKLYNLFFKDYNLNKHNKMSLFLVLSKNSNDQFCSPSANVSMEAISVLKAN